MLIKHFAPTADTAKPLQKEKDELPSAMAAMSTNAVAGTLALWQNAAKKGILTRERSGTKLTSANWPAGKSRMVLREEQLPCTAVSMEY
eukprot:scaffold180677_cov33-Prasinocladus_malaysianus.AAC.2